jgi:hypothetical protein
MQQWFQERKPRIRAPCIESSIYSCLLDYGRNKPGHQVQGNHGILKHELSLVWACGFVFSAGKGLSKWWARANQYTIACSENNMPFCCSHNRYMVHAAKTAGQGWTPLGSLWAPKQLPSGDHGSTRYCSLLAPCHRRHDRATERNT